MVAPSRLNECWAADFMSDVLTTGRWVRIFNVVDARSREGLACEADTSLPAARSSPSSTSLRWSAVHIPRASSITGRRGGVALDQWAYEYDVTPAFIQPGKPMQNGFAESFTGRLPR
jgi:putative transposase